jgi:hypothetical protein
MIEDRTQQALARIDSALARIEQAGTRAGQAASRSAEEAAQQARKHDRLRQAVAETLRDLDLLIGEKAE